MKFTRSIRKIVGLALALGVAYALLHPFINYTIWEHWTRERRKNEGVLCKISVLIEARGSLAKVIYENKLPPEFGFDSGEISKIRLRFESNGLLIRPSLKQAPGSKYWDIAMRSITDEDYWYVYRQGSVERLPNKDFDPNAWGCLGCP
jgi:hypothetical protein